MAYLYTTEGVREQRKPKSGAQFTLEELQEMVGGYIELVPGTTFMFCNEDGRRLRLAPNREASLLAGMVLVGNVVACEPSEVD